MKSQHLAICLPDGGGRVEDRIVVFQSAARGCLGLILGRNVPYNNLDRGPSIPRNTLSVSCLKYQRNRVELCLSRVQHAHARDRTVVYPVRRALYRQLIVNPRALDTPLAG